MILNIETSTSVCSVSLSEKNKLIDQKISFKQNSHSKLLAIFIDQLLKKNKIKPKKLDAVSVSQGPGSYTGLRIGVSIAKAMAYSLNIKLIAIDTLQIITYELINNYQNILNNNTFLCPMIDARRDEVYTAFYDYKANKINKTSNLIIDKYSFSTPLQSKKIIFFGNGAPKCKKFIKHHNAIFIDNIVPLAQNMTIISYKKFIDEKFEDIAYFEPFYLKPFIATKAKNKLK